MSNNKSGLPDIKEIGSMANKLFGDISKSVKEILHNYQTRHASHAPKTKTTASKTTTTKTTTAKPKKTVKKV